MKAKQPKLTVGARRPEQREIESRGPAKPTAAPKRRLTVPSKGGHKPPPGGGWRRTPNGWAKGQGDNYQWKPLNWAENEKAKPKRTPEHERFNRKMDDAGWQYMSGGPGYASWQTYDRTRELRIDKVGDEWVLVSGDKVGGPELGRFESMSAARPAIIAVMRRSK
jgi:hypothetical protein